MPRLTCSMCKIRSQTAGQEHIHFHEIPFKDPERLLMWELNVQLKFEPKTDKHLCDLHFDDDQFDEAHTQFLRTQKLFSKKRKLIHNACPKQKEPVLTPYLIEAEAGLKKSVAPSSPKMMQKPNKTYSRKLLVPTVSSHAVEDSDIIVEDKNPPCTSSSTPKKRNISAGQLHQAEAKRPLIDVSPVKYFSDTSMSEGADEDLDDLSYQVSAGVSQLESDLSAEMSMERTKQVLTSEEKAAGFKLVLCETSQLDMLLKRCQICGAAVENNTIRKFATGAMLTFEHRCQNQHNFKWRTSELHDKTPLINVDIAAAALCSGISYAALERFSEATEMAFISQQTYDKHKANFVYPVIKNEYWVMHQKIMQQMKQMTDLVFAGDGRFDSPGKNSAKYCLYSILEATTDLIVDFVVFQKNIEPGELESKAFKLVFQRVVDQVTEQKIKVFCSDRSLTVGRKMKDYFKAINHAFDVWHLAKGVNKALQKLSNKFPGIRNWRKAIVNHMWFAAQNCGESADEIIRIWESMLFHLQNVHEWVDKKGTTRRCMHAPLSDEKKDMTDWIEDELEIHALKKALFNTRIMNQLRQCRFFVHTSSLENFHNVCLVYAPKRTAYTYEGMVVRTMLAIFDHNSNVGRKVVGEKIVYSKVSKEYKLHNRYEEKNQAWRKDLVKKCVEFVLNPEIITFNPAIDELLMPFDLPDNIVPPATLKPSLDELRKKKEQVSRM